MCDKKKIIGLLLEASKDVNQKFAALEDTLDTELEIHHSALDKIAHVGLEILGINADSTEGDRFFWLFFDYTFGEEDKEEIIEKLMEI